MKRILLLLIGVVGLLSPTAAYDIILNYNGWYEVYYNIISPTEAELAGMNCLRTMLNPYLDLYYFDSQVKKNGVTYNVVGIAENAFQGQRVSWDNKLENLSYIGANAFRDCVIIYPYYGGSMNIDAETIGEGAFSGIVEEDGRWLDFEISNRVKHIGKHAFASDAINYLILDFYSYLGEVPPIAEDPCEERHYSQIEVITKDVDLLKATDGWKNFKTFLYYYGQRYRDNDGVVAYDLDAINHTAKIRSGVSYHARHILDGQSLSVSQTFYSERYEQLFTITTIGEYAIGGNELRSLSLSSSIASVEQGAFIYCPALTEVEVQASTPPLLAPDAFTDEVFASAILFVPADALSLYRQSSGWQRFAHIMAIDSSVASLLDFEDVTGYSHSVRVKAMKPDRTLPANSTFPITVTIAGKQNVVMGCEGVSFDGQPNVETISFPIGYESIGSFKDCISLRSVSIPASVEKICSETFKGCTTLADVRLDKGIEQIQNGAFDGCQSLSSITLPSTIKNIDSNAFRGTALTDVTIYATQPPVLFTNAFIDRWDKVTLHVPFGTKASYTNTPNYNKFKAIVELPTDNQEPEPVYADFPDIPIIHGCWYVNFKEVGIADGFVNKISQGIYLNQMADEGDSYDAEEGAIELHSPATCKTRPQYAPVYFKHTSGGIILRLPKGRGKLLADVDGSYTISVGGSQNNKGAVGGTTNRCKGLWLSDIIEIEDSNGTNVFIHAKKNGMDDGCKIYGLAWIPEENKAEIDIMHDDMYTAYDKSYLQDVNFSNMILCNVYYSLDNARQLSEDDCINVNGNQDETTMDQIVRHMSGVASLSPTQYTGLVMKIPAGRSFISMRANGDDGSTLCVRIGQQPVQAIPCEEGERDYLVECNTDSPTFVYIYCGGGWEHEVRLYSLRWSSANLSDLRTLTSSSSKDSHSTLYFSPDGRRSLSPTNGLNIIRMNDGTVRKTIIDRTNRIK